MPHFLEGDIGNAASLGGGEIGAAGVATIGGGLPRRRAGAGDMAIEHRHKALGCDLGQLCGHRLQFVSAGLGSGNQLVMEPALFVLPATVLDGAGSLISHMLGFGAVQECSSTLPIMSPRSSSR